MKKFVNAVRPLVGKTLVVAGVGLGLQATVGQCFATGDTTITDTTAALSTAWTAIETVAAAVVLFVLGRRLLRKL